MLHKFKIKKTQTWEQNKLNRDEIEKAYSGASISRVEAIKIEEWTKDVLLSTMI